MAIGTTTDDIPTCLGLYEKARRPRMDIQVIKYTRLNGRDDDDTPGQRISGHAAVEMVNFMSPFQQHFADIGTIDLQTLRVGFNPIGILNPKSTKGKSALWLKMFQLPRVCRGLIMNHRCGFRPWSPSGELLSLFLVSPKAEESDEGEYSPENSRREAAPLNEPGR
ncbi:hypothetical protein P175DRAFT_0532630 [Aspergillus ochraceoroseus IBT 24754]|uniref:Uncharacterized protein n=1 Tax=Aspergillus ochraceoroseus IBT 24754 TaxID=1392256 RepID=A0A2T5LYA7_9EURO|nr:uncharacterized protein P175DRAFT_0532630 [Aspergillus ochraceoroseus IBT 24754]PTU21249.1 hypothetical protein P175DRAFT_0532630 [Aspergillus ochraceoroseus IBT 24754]